MAEEEDEKKKKKKLGMFEFDNYFKDVFCFDNYVKLMK
jgi:hypothetical protein